jgi:protein-S-isoprenylcysteine O-methyltransferase Ste14
MSLSRLRVPAGYAAFLLVLALARPSLAALALAAPVALAGEAVRVWASGHIDKTRALATGGPYAHTRNPLYLGSVLLGVAVGIGTGSVWALLPLLAYFAVFYPAVIRQEESFLRGKFKLEYSRWAQDVPLLLPRLRPGGPRASRFSWERVRGNREWRTALALPVVLALLYARAHLLRW